MLYVFIIEITQMCRRTSCKCIW